MCILGLSHCGGFCVLKSYRCYHLVQNPYSFNHQSPIIDEQKFQYQFGPLYLILVLFRALDKHHYSALPAQLQEMRELPGSEGILFVVMVKQEMCSFVSSKSKELVLAYISPDCALCYCSHLGFISGSLCRQFVCWDLSYSWIHSFLRPLSHRLLSCE